MATWIAHMRIAEHFMKKDAALDNALFLVGNIGPDCGVPNEDWSVLRPISSLRIGGVRTARSSTPRISRRDIWAKTAIITRFTSAIIFIC